MTMQSLYNYILIQYGQRGSWISDIAKQLKISYEDANYLTYILGYRRGKAAAIITSLSVFSADPKVKLILRKI